MRAMSPKASDEITARTAITPVRLGIFRSHLGLGELLEEAHVAGVEVAYVGDAVLHHCDTLDTHAEGEAGDLFGVVGVVGGVCFATFFGYCGEDGGVDHATAQEFDPAAVFALAAAFAAAE